MILTGSCFGGSNTEGLLLDDEETLPTLLGRELTERTRSRIWVGSAAQGDLAATHHSQFLRNCPWLDEVDLVVCPVGVNDLLRIEFGQPTDEFPRPVLAELKFVRGLLDAIRPKGILLDDSGQSWLHARKALEYPRHKVDWKTELEHFVQRVDAIVDAAR